MTVELSLLFFQGPCHHSDSLGLDSLEQTSQLFFGHPVVTNKLKTSKINFYTFPVSCRGFCIINWFFLIKKTLITVAVPVPPPPSKVSSEILQKIPVPKDMQQLLAKFPGIHTIPVPNKTLTGTNDIKDRSIIQKGLKKFTKILTTKLKNH